MQHLIEGRWLQAHGVFALRPAAAVDDDVIEIYSDESRTRVALRWQPLRLQTERPVVDGVPRPNRSLADFIAPAGGPPDCIGLFAVRRDRGQRHPTGPGLRLPRGCGGRGDTGAGRCAAGARLCAFSSAPCSSK